MLSRLNGYNTLNLIKQFLSAASFADFHSPYPVLSDPSASSKTPLFAMSLYFELPGTSPATLGIPFPLTNDSMTAENPSYHGFYCHDPK
ncbi:hypothetical protein AVEN_2971-1 [Araneus ventricosus]|uniref:Uncharacterized protein n=1 Tax=Araneus ventricosus TaxID=182803 RepID=A0A4Y2VPJ0_ARAVE|nr:hypothetical protein AVEN_2971-1 [Araneus ventricosus]